MDEELPFNEPTHADPPAACAEIDAMSYADMLRKVRTASLSDPMFRGEIGRYFHARMKERRHALPEDVRADIHDKNR